jgi:hypothetical protein
MVLLQLAQPQTWDDMTDQTMSRNDTEIGQGHVDNSQDGIVARDVPSVDDLGSFNGNLHDKIMGLLESLKNHLNQSMESLQRNSVRAAIDFSTFIRDLEDEVEDLRADEKRK